MIDARPQHRPGDAPSPRAIVWARVSTAEQAAEGRSGIPRQIESARKIADAKGYSVLEVIEVSDVSGTSTLAAPEMQRLIQMAESGEVDVVIAFVPEASMGTAIEMWEAHEHGCGIVIAISPLSHNWTVRFCSHIIFLDINAFETELSSGVLEERIERLLEEKRRTAKS